MVNIPEIVNTPDLWLTYQKYGQYTRNVVDIQKYGQHTRNMVKKERKKATVRSVHSGSDNHF